ncbi:hypothetical protein [[Clostridium] scindens]|uniref:hypothetical protein n=1 Tax=Clostridium scindens (strain JCM 10418 / VPI 12708) TaxID=29347 RepID=UPI0039F45E67
MKKDTVKTICRGEARKWESREQAKIFFQRAVILSEGHERQRYINILTRLAMGKRVCSDEEV